MYRARVLPAALGLASGLLLHAAVPSYFTTTVAGSVPPIANPIAAKQYLNPMLEPLYPSYAVNAVAYDGKGNLYYSNGTQVWRLNPDGTDTLIAGLPVPTKYSGDGGPATLASLTSIFALSFDGAENLYIAVEDRTDNYTAAVRKVTADQNITTVATTPSYYLGLGMAVDSAGNVYVTQDDIHSDTFSLVVYATDGTSTNLVLDLNGAGQVAVGGSYVYFEDDDGLHQWNLQTSSEVVLVSKAGNGGPNDSGLTALPDGTAYFVGANNGVETVSPTGASVTLVAGSAINGYSGDGGPATAAQVTPVVMAVNPLTGTWPSAVIMSSA
jgi:hypothetical protein